MDPSIDENSIRVENKIYSSKKLADLHPGGPLFIKAFSGRDASQAFISYHRRLFPHSRVEKALVKVDNSVNYDNEDHKDFVQLCEIVDKVLPRMKSFAPWHYYVKVAFILTVAFGLEIFMHVNKFYDWRLSALLGFFYALIGLNIQHDANHGAISRNPNVNRLLGMTQNWIGGSAVNWIHQHVVQHHVHTNDVHLDPDLAGSVYLRLNPTQPLMKYQMVQHFYFFVLLGLYGFVVVYSSLANIVRGKHHTPMSSLVKRHRVFETFTSFLFFFRWICIPLYQTNCDLNALVNTLPMYIVGGYYLAFFFSISHNFKGVHILEDTRRESNHKGDSFLYKQVVSSSNVGGSFLCFLNGGLNYQIEHHLFPRISHCHYPTIAPVVRRFCQERSIPYVHFETVGDNLQSCTEHLWDMGSNEKPKTINFNKLLS
uniref:Front-end desaturase n=1 Tax=Platychelipus littoralis TaxID=2593136 RepID=A0A9E8LSM0_9MAXI|nr:front-end desaturase [Platychelipus littoralis]